MLDQYADFLCGVTACDEIAERPNFGIVAAVLFGVDSFNVLVDLDVE